jgi:lambda repressor-like predicted transcriptional regulator
VFVVDLAGRLSNPLEIAEALVAQGSESISKLRDSTKDVQNDASHDQTAGALDPRGQLSNPAQRRLSPTDIGDLIAAYQAGASIRELAADFGVHRTTVAAHLDLNRIRRLHALTDWADDTLREAAELYKTGSSLADVAARYGIDPKTVASRFKRAGVTVRPRRGWPP